MFSIATPHKNWSDTGLRILIISIAAAIGLALADGVMKGPVEDAMIASGHISRPAVYVLISTWIVDFRYLAEQAIYAATIFFVGAKFIETRTVFSVGFDKVDASRVAMKGPDDDNVVWIGYRYANRLEAETIAAAFEDRLKQSASV